VETKKSFFIEETHISFRGNVSFFSRKCFCFSDKRDQVVALQQHLELTATSGFGQDQGTALMDIGPTYQASKDMSQ